MDHLGGKESCEGQVGVGVEDMVHCLPLQRTLRRSDGGWADAFLCSGHRTSDGRETGIRGGERLPELGDKEKVGHVNMEHV